MPPREEPPLLVVLHAFGDSARGLTFGGFSRAPAERLLTVAPAVAPDLGDSWGNAQALDRVRAAIAYGRSAHGLADRPVVLVGTSMGALTALNLALADPGDVGCMLLALPVVAPGALHDCRDEQDRLRRSLVAAHGGRPPGAVDPSLRLAAIRALNIPASWWYSADDPVTPAKVVRRCARAIGVRAMSLGRVGHDPYSVDAEAAAAFTLRWWQQAVATRR